VVISMEYRSCGNLRSRNTEGIRTALYSLLKWKVSCMYEAYSDSKYRFAVKSN